MTDLAQLLNNDIPNRSGEKQTLTTMYLRLPLLAIRLLLFAAAASTAQD